MTTEEEIAQLRGIAESTDSRLANIQESNLGIHATLRLMNGTLLEIREDLRQTRTEAQANNQAVLETLREMRAENQEMRTEARADSKAVLETLREMRDEAQVNSRAILETLQEMNVTLRRMLPRPNRPLR
jgi:type IV secretory pathway VirB4 component